MSRYGSRVGAGCGGGADPEDADSGSPDDWRRHDLTLGSAGEATLASAQALLRTGLGTLLADLPPSATDALARFLETVEALLTGTTPPPRPRRPPSLPAGNPLGRALARFECFEHVVVTLPRLTPGVSKLTAPRRSRTYYRRATTACRC